MDLKEFATDFMDTVNDAVINDSKDIEEELTESILDYVIDSGDACAPTVCTFKKNMARINAYDYNDEGDSLDLFVLVQTNSLLGKISNNEIDKNFNRLYGFFMQTLMDKINNNNSEPFEGFNEVSELINEAVKRISTLRLFILTNGLCEYNTSTVEMDNGMIMEQNVWDIQRIYQQDCIKRGKEKIEIDFPAIYGTKLPCLKVEENCENINSYLAVIPATTLAQIYKKYKHALLEKNVRTFLQFKPKVNRNIKNTLVNEPNMFFSFNNGISSTANDIEIVKEGSTHFIKKLTNWQIVNGGQTTGTIASVYNENKANLENVFVPMKISVIKDKENGKEIIDKISRSANSQTAIKNSDFSANDPFLVDFEYFSRNEWIPNKNSKPEHKWYFERTRGQYLDELSQRSGTTAKIFRKEYPKNMKLTKTDIAIYEECWNGKPYVACKGGEESYKQFIKDIKSKREKCTLTYYKKMVAKAILFKAIDSISKAHQVSGYKSCVNAYILYCVSSISNQKLDLDYIWENQSIQQELKSFISENLLPFVCEHLSINIPAPSRYARTLECLEKLTEKLKYLPSLPFTTINENDESDNEIRKQAKLERIKEAEDIPAETWLNIVKWAKANNKFTPLERRQLYNYGVKKQNGKNLSFKQSCEGIDLLNEAISQGFKK